jgi:hypothetical protein
VDVALGRLLIRGEQRAEFHELRLDQVRPAEQFERNLHVVVLVREEPLGDADVRKCDAGDAVIDVAFDARKRFE